MGKKILKILFIVFLVMVIFTIGLIGYRASIVYKIYKARKLVFSNDNIKIVSENKHNFSDNAYWDRTIVYKKGNIARTQTITDFVNNKPSNDYIYDLDNKKKIDVIEKNFYEQPNANIFLSNWYNYSMPGSFYINALSEITFEEKFFYFSDYARMVLKGNPHYFVDENGREAISVQFLGNINYCDKDTGILYERYELHLDGTTELVQKYNVEFDVVTEEDLDYGDISEYYYHVP